MEIDKTEFFLATAKYLFFFFVSLLYAALTSVGKNCEFKEQSNIFRCIISL